MTNVLYFHQIHINNWMNLVESLYVRLEALPVFAGSEDRETEERPQDLGEHGEDGRDDIGDGELEHEVVHPRHLVRRRPKGQDEGITKTVGHDI